MTKQEHQDTIELCDDDCDLDIGDFWDDLGIGDNPCHISPIRYRPGMRSWLLPLCVSSMWFLNGIVATILFFQLTTN